MNNQEKKDTTNVDTVANQTVPAVDVEVNKETAMKDALSHTTQFTPFHVPKEEQSELADDVKSNKRAIVFIVTLLILLLAFIFLLPYIAKIF